MPHKDPATYKAYHDKYHADNAERLNEGARRRYYDNAEERRAKQREYNAANKEQRAASRKAHYKENPDFYKERNIRRFWVTLDQYRSVLATQRGVCAICGKPETAKHQSGKQKDLAIDHDHATGAFRGLLCVNCNNGLGRFKDSPELLISAAKYLKGK